MASAKKLAAPAADSAPDVVKLYSEDLGETRDFEPAHAKALLAYQEGKGYAHWQLATEAQASDADKSE